MNLGRGDGDNIAHPDHPLHPLRQLLYDLDAVKSLATRIDDQKLTCPKEKDKGKDKYKPKIKT